MKIINADIRDAVNKLWYHYVVHQCNCTSKTAHGVAPLLFDIYPEAHYLKNPDREFGTFQIFENPKFRTKLINIYTQRIPGAARYHSEYTDRLRAFRDVLTKIPFGAGATVALPYQIGCGLAKGNWLDYEGILLDVEEELSKSGVEFTLFRLKK